MGFFSVMEKYFGVYEFKKDPSFGGSLLGQLSETNDVLNFIYFHYRAKGDSLLCCSFLIYRPDHIGIKKEWLNVLTELCREWGKKQILITVVRDTNIGGFLKANGFTVTENEKYNTITAHKII